MTQTEFLLNMLNFYTQDVTRRAISAGGFCKYKTEHGQKCAIGRYIPDEKYNPSIEGYCINPTYGIKPIDLIPVEITHLGIEFLKHMQDIHDGKNNWDENGLTRDGKEFIKRLIKEYTLNESDFEKFLN